MIENAKITSTMLGVEDHGVMTFYITCEWSGAGCSFGGYGLDFRSDEDEPRKGYGTSYQSIRCILETLRLDRWEKLNGTTNQNRNSRSRTWNL